LKSVCVAAAAYLCKAKQMEGERHGC
jgi:hypothetical protein